MKIAFDHWSTSEPGSDRGLGRYATTLSTSLSSDPRFAPVYVRKSDRSSTASLLHLQRQIDHVVADCMLYHATVPEHLPLIKRLPWVCSIQDVIPLDLRDYRRMGIKSRLKYANSTRANIILANSEYTASRVTQRLGIQQEKIVVAPIPVAETFADPQASSDIIGTGLEGQKYVVGLVDDRAPDPRKRYHWIDQIALALKDSAVQMVVTGIEVNSARYPNCIVLPAMSDAELAGLYRNATAFFYPSAYEGQGLPPLEAMATGCPVIAFKNSSVDEMVGVPEFLIADPAPWQQERLTERAPLHTVQECVEKMSAIAEDSKLRDELSTLAIKRSTGFTLANLADQLADAYEKAMA